MDETVQTDCRMNRAERWLNGERSEKIVIVYPAERLRCCYRTVVCKRKNGQG